MVIEISVSTAKLDFVASTDVVAVNLVDQLRREAITAPTFVCVFGCSSGIPSSRTGIDALVVGHGRVTAEELDLELAARIILLITPVVTIDCRSIGGPWANLLRDGVAEELDRLLAKVGITGVHNPRCSAIVAINVDLGLRYRAKQNGGS